MKRDATVSFNVTSINAVVSNGNAAIVGADQSNGGSFGVAGSSLNGDGVYGQSGNGRGVYGINSTNIGVYGSGSEAFGVYGTGLQGWLASATATKSEWTALEAPPLWTPLKGWGTSHSARTTQGGKGEWFLPSSRALRCTRRKGNPMGNRTAFEQWKQAQAKAAARDYGQTIKTVFNFLNRRSWMKATTNSCQTRR